MKPKPQTEPPMDVPTMRHVASLFAMHALISNPVANQCLCDDDPCYQKLPDGQYNFAQVVAINAIEFADALIAELDKTKP